MADAWTGFTDRRAQKAVDQVRDISAEALS